MDLMLPGINGFETARLIRKAGHENYGRQPFMIALTANTLDNDRERCLKEGMDEYISKPFDMKKLNDILKKLISGSTVI
jgi:CheY-like chemotaxis protein